MTMKSDKQLKQDIETELMWDPAVNSAQIGVSVDNAAVSLLGTVDTFAQKWAAEDATKRVSGVRAVAQDLTVKLLGVHERSDTELASATLDALKWNVAIPSSVTAKVEKGHVTLEGNVAWYYQRAAAVQAVRCLTGVIEVHNNITLAPQVSVTQVKEKVQAALQRQASTDANAIHIEAAGGTVTLTGHASSFHALHDATMAAWTAPGVTEVVDRMTMSI